MTAKKAAIGEVTAEMFVPPEGPWADSFEDLFRRESLGMVRLAFLIVGSVPLAEEIVQDAFARLLERWDATRRRVAGAGRPLAGPTGRTQRRPLQPAGALRMSYG